MNKKLFRLSPLILSALLIQQKTFSMHRQNTVTLSFLDELRKHKLFVRASQQETSVNPTECQLIEEVTLELPQEVGAPAHKEVEPDKASLNLAISQLISGSIATQEEEWQEESHGLNPQPSQKCGYSWSLTFKALTYSKPELLSYALDNHIFDTQNVDHINLLNQSIIECVNTKNYETMVALLEKIRSLKIDRAHLENNATTAALDYIVSEQKTRRTASVETFVHLSAQKQIEVAATIKKLQEDYAAAQVELVKMLNLMNNEEKTFKAQFRDNSNQEKKLLSALRKISNPQTVNHQESSTWEEHTKPSKETFTRLNLTKQAFAQQQAAIEHLSTHLALDNK